jgi:hypothetical protein
VSERVTFTADEAVPEVEQAITKVLRAYPGSWIIKLEQQLAGGWWCLRVSTEGFERSLLLRPDECTPEAVSSALKSTLDARAGKRWPPPPPACPDPPKTPDR